MLRTNEKNLAMLSVTGEIWAPMGMPLLGYDGKTRVIPATGGITYNIKVGDSAFTFVGDHLEPGVTSKNKEENPNSGYNILACIGNTATMRSGDAKGEQGTVTGKHGGAEHVIIHFTPDILDKLTVGDKIQIRGFGQGLELLDYPTVGLMNMSPTLLNNMGIVEKDGKLEVPVAREIPPEFMGSGLGKSLTERGDYDITTMEMDRIKELGIDKLRLGDIIAIKDSSSFHGRSYRRGGVIIGIVIHGNSFVSGHGPGVTSLMTSLDGTIQPVKVEKANIAEYLNLV